MEVRILGPLEIIGEDGALSLPGGRARSLLAVLTVHAGVVMSTDRLIEDLWGPSPPATARTKLQGLVSTLRKHMEPRRSQTTPPRVIRTRAPGYVLALGPDRVDANRFRRVLRAALDAPAQEKRELLRGTRTVAGAGARRLRL